MEYRTFLKNARGKTTQKKFAEELGVSREFYGRVERGDIQPSFTWIKKTADKLGAKVEINIEMYSNDNEQIELELVENESNKKKR